MRAILQRVKSASVVVEKQLVSSIGPGVLVFAAIAPTDTIREMESMANKIVKMKMWPDDGGVNWKKNAGDIQGEILCVSQFTLLASTKKGSKPDFHGASGGDHASTLYEVFVSKVQSLHGEERVKDGVFQAMMDVALVNDGPVTLQLEVEPLKPPQQAVKKSDSKQEVSAANPEASA